MDSYYKENLSVWRNFHGFDFSPVTSFTHDRMVSKPIVTQVGEKERERGREGKRDREKERQTDRQTDRQTEKKRGKEIESEENKREIRRLSWIGRKGEER